MNPTEKPRICFYGLYCYPLFNSEYNNQVGGWETRMTLIAKELAKRGFFDVSMIVANYGQPHMENREGVELYSWLDKVGVSPAVKEAASPAEPGAEAIENEEGQTQSMSESGSPRRPLSGSITKWLQGHGEPGRNLFLLGFLTGELNSLTSDFILEFREAVRLFIHAIKTLWFSFKKFGRSGLTFFLNPYRFVKSLAAALFMVSGVLDSKGQHVIWKKDIQIFEEVNADLYVVLGNHAVSAFAAHFCELKKKKYIFLAGSEYDYLPEYKTEPDGHDMYLQSHFIKNYAIEHASFHIVQTPKQAQMLKQGYGRDSLVIRNPINIKRDFDRIENPEKILWVGKADERIKRPSLILELARRMPDRPFVIIMNQAVPETFAESTKIAKQLKNVTLIEQVPFAEVEKYFAEARLFVSTSVFEGFPNTFLQAAKYGVPIVSTDVDPGEMLSDYGCGLTSGGDFEVFTRNVQFLLDDPKLYNHTSDCALEYVRKFHDKEMVIKQYETAFLNVLKSES